MHRVGRAGLLALVACAVASGCGGKFELPTERPQGRVIPSDGSYGQIGNWGGMDGLQDILITQAQGNQLFVLFNQGGPAGPGVAAPEVRLYPLTNLTKPIVGRFFSPMRTLYNPIALAAGLNPLAARTEERLNLFVLDQGDSCLAKFDIRRGTCAADADTTNATGHPFRSQVFDYSTVWRVREYAISGGDTLSTFTDTTVAMPWGIAADEQGRVYVGGVAVFLDSLQTNKSIRTRKFVSRVYRYSRGPKYAGIPDVNMPGSATWHRDSTWLVLDGTGDSFISDPRGLHWSRLGTGPLFVADRGNNQAKAVSTNLISVPVVNVDGQATGASFNAPEDVTADLAGFFYVVDRHNSRILRYSTSGEYIQRVDVQSGPNDQVLVDPVAVAVDDSLAYVADRGSRQIVLYKRQP